MICILIPMYNEASGVSVCVDAVFAAIGSQGDIALMVVNDGSTDDTLTMLKKKQRHYGKRLLIVSYKQNKGYGGALETGVREVIARGFEFVLFMDSDLTNDPHDIKRFVQVVQGNVDCVKATRYSLGGKMVGVPLYRQLISWIANQCAACAFRLGVHDCTNGFRCVRVSLFKGIHFKEKKFAIILEELYYLKRQHARCVEIPVVLTARVKSVSSFSYKPRVFWEYGKYLLKAALI